MNFPIRMGSTISCGGRRNLECGKLSRCKTQGWMGIGYCFAMDEAYRIWSSQWYPIGTIIVTECAIDVDLFCIDTERTLDANAFPLLARSQRTQRTSNPIGAGLVERDHLIALTGFLFGILSVFLGRLIGYLYVYYVFLSQ